MKRRIITLMVFLAMVASLLTMPMSALASGKFMTVTTNANLRSNTNLYDVIGTLKKGTTVYYTGKKYKSMYQVKTSKGKVGYVFKMYLKNADSKDGDGQVVCVKENSTLYKKADTASRSVCKLAKGRYLKILSVEGDWAKVQTTDDRIGYIQVSKLKEP